MTESEDFDIDPAVAEAMGFSSFGMQSGKRRKLNANIAFIDPETGGEGRHGQSKQAHAMTSDNPFLSSSVGPPGSKQRISRPSATEGTVQRSNISDGSAITTASTKGTVSTTNIDLNDEKCLKALAYGIRNENGDMVYFQPSFLENPWEGLRPK